MYIENNNALINEFLLFVDNKYILTKTSSKESPSLYVRNIDYSIIWKHSLAKHTAQIKIFQNKVYIFENSQTTTIDLATGIIEGQSDRLILNINDETESSIWISTPQLISSKYGDSFSKIPLNKSHKTFYKDVLIEQLYNSDIISCTNIETGTKIWEKSCSGIYGEIIPTPKFLYISIKGNNKSNDVIEIDLFTGEITDQFNEMNGKLILHYNSLYSAHKNIIQQIDLKNRSTRSIIINSNSHEINMNWNTARIHKNILFFIDGFHTPTNRFGAIELNTHSLKWFSEIAINDGINNNIIRIDCNDDFLFLSCSDNSIHKIKYS